MGGGTCPTDCMESWKGANWLRPPAFVSAMAVSGLAPYRPFRVALYLHVQRLITSAANVAWTLSSVATRRASATISAVRGAALIEQVYGLPNG